MKILLADDEEALADTLARALGRAGHVVLTVSDGRAALRAIETEGPFDALISDMSMGGVDGFEVARKFRARHPRGKICIVTGNIDPAIGAEAASIGISFREKPVRKDDLLAWLAEP